MADDSRIQVVIELDDGSVKQGFIRVEKAAQDAAGNISGFFQRAGAIAAGITLEKAFSSFFSFLKTGFTDSIRAAKEQENSINRLANSLSTAGTFSQKALGEFQALAETIQETTTIQDDNALSLAALARNYTKTNEQAKALTIAAIDLSAQLGVDLNTAAQTIGSTFSGIVPRSLVKTVDGLKSLTQEQLRSGIGLDLIAKRFKGAAENEVKTFSGSIIQLQNTINSFQAELGRFIVSSPAVLAVFKVLKDTVLTAKKTIGEFKGGDADVFKPLILSAINLGKALNVAVVIPFQITFQSIKVIVNDVAQIIFGLIGDIAGFAGRAVSFLSPGSAVGEKLLLFKDFAAQTFADLGKSTDESLKKITDSFSGEDVISKSLEATRVAVEATSGALNDLGKNARNGVNGASEAMDALAAKTKQLNLIVQTAIRDSISKSIQLVIKNISDGKNAFQGLLKTIGGIFGDMLITIGESVLLTGIGMEAVRESIVGLTGGPAIFAGIALIAAGSLLKALTGGGGKSSDVPTTSASGGGSTTTPINEPTVVDEKAQQRVVVNIQGDVLDSRETSLRIVELINEGIAEQGAQITARAN